MAYCGPRGIPRRQFLSWDPDDQADALEWQAHENRRCPSCRTHPDDWAENDHAHHAHLSDQCPGCLRQHSAQQGATDQGKKLLPPGVQVVLPHGAAADCPRCNPPDR